MFNIIGCAVISLSIILFLDIEIDYSFFFLFITNAIDFFLLFICIIYFGSIPRSSITGSEGKNILESYYQISFRKIPTVNIKNKVYGSGSEWLTS